jgi:membrane protein required for beta-lactamase induction
MKEVAHDEVRDPLGGRLVLVSLLYHYLACLFWLAVVAVIGLVALLLYAAVSVSDVLLINP